MPTLILVRHGQSQWNLENRFTGWWDVDLTEKGVSEAVAAGDTVTWTNREIARHTVTADNGAFDSGSLKDGDRFSFTFDTPGTFTYFCEFHTSMKASVTVTDEG